MSQPPLKLTHDERILAWRAERAGAAERARGERLRIASLDRDARMEQFEADKEKRIETSRLKREAEQAETEAQRRQAAASRLAGLEDLTDAADEMRRARRQRNRQSLLRLALFAGLPVLLTLVYMTGFATPIYQAETTIALRTSGPAAQADHAPFDVLTFMQSPDMLAALQSQVGYLDQFSGPDMDPARRLRNLSWLGFDEYSLFRRYVRAKIDPYSGHLTLRVMARSPASAEAASLLVLALTEACFRADAAGPSRTAASFQQAGANLDAAMINAGNSMFQIIASPFSSISYPYRSSLKTVVMSGIISTTIYSFLSIFAASFLYYSRR